MSGVFRLKKALEFLRLREAREKLEVAESVRELEKADALVKASEVAFIENLNTGVENLDPFWGQHAAMRSNALLSQTKLSSNIRREADEALAAKRQNLGALAMKREALENLERKHGRTVRKTELRKAQADVDEAFRLARTNRKPEGEE